MRNIEELYKEYYTTVYKYLFCLTQNHDISEELTQETFTEVIKDIGKFRGECKLSVWLCQIAKHLWYKELKKKDRNKNIYSQFEINDALYCQTLEETVCVREEKLKFFKDMQNIDEKSREIIYLRMIGNLSYEEIGEIVGRTSNCCRVMFYRTKQKLREENKKIKREECRHAEQSKIKFLRKYRTRKILLKIIGISFIVVFIMIFSIFCIKFIPNYYIISKACNKLNELKNMENYKVTIEEIHLDHEIQKEDVFITKYYYKDGNFKEENAKTELIYYGNENSVISTVINKNTSEVSEGIKKENIFDRFSGDLMAYNRNMIEKLGVIKISVEENEYDGKECFVLVMNEDAAHYREIWIDKETMMPVREIQDIPEFSHHYERNIKVEKNIVTDDDIMMAELEK